MSEISLKVNEEFFNLIKDKKILYLIFSYELIKYNTDIINKIIIYNSNNYNIFLLKNVINKIKYRSIAELIIFNNNLIVGKNYNNDYSIFLLRKIFNIYDNESVILFKINN